MTVEEWLGKNNQLGIDIWEKKYRYGDETFEEWLDRVSGHDKELKDLIREKKFLFGGRILSNRGVNDVKTSLSNCYVIAPPDDSIESIYETCSKLARTYSYGGGCGIDISKLSPDGAKVRNQAKRTSGAVSFMDTFSQVTEQIGQNGRRGALMISINCKHPDLEKFITVKSDLKKVTSANISVRVTDEFMQAVENDDKWELSFTRPETGETIAKEVKAKDIYKLLCENNWNYAEPGILFWDRIENYNLLNNNKEFSYGGVNPCAEEPLPPGGSCLLGSLNLAAFVNEENQFNWEEFTKAVHISVRALNVVLDEGIERHPLQEQKDTVKKWRQIGLGIMGLADALIKMKIAYGSKDAITMSNFIGEKMAVEAIKESAMLAKEYGAYENYNRDVLSSAFYKTHFNSPCEIAEQYGLRNSQILTIAPTGSISTMIGVSGGAEPIFANSYTRTTKSLHGHDEVYKVYTPIVEEYMKNNGIEDEKKLPEWFVTSATIPIEQRIAMQSVWQTHIDASISSTVNLPHEATIEDVEKLYLEAWRKGLKGITVYRAGCAREGILVEHSEPIENSTQAINSTEIPRGVIFQCSDNLIGKKRKLQTGCGSLHVQAWFDENTGEMLEVYLPKGSTGGCNNCINGLSRLISLSLRGGISIYDIKDQLDSSGVCPSYATRSAKKHDTSKGSSCPVAVGNALVEMYEEMQKQFLEENDDEYDDIIEESKAKKVKTKEAKKEKIPKCPECGDDLIFEGGCVTCKSCGWSKCG